MATSKRQGQQANEELRPELPPGVKLLHTLEGHRGTVWSVAFDPQGGMLASGSGDNALKLWETRSGNLLRTLEGQTTSLASLQDRW
jgi:WD40 repeat protein